MMFGKMNSLLYKSLESGVTLCKLRGNPCVRLEHWLSKIIESPGNDLATIVDHQRLSVAAIKTELANSLDRLPDGSESVLDLDQTLENATERSWVYATLMFRSGAIRSGHLLTGLLKTPSLLRELQSISTTLASLDVDQVIDDFAKATATSIEHDMAASDGSAFGQAPTPHQRDLFISYRRAESQHLAGRIFDHLGTAFGVDRVFKDVDSIQIGARDFAEEIRNQLKSSRLMIALIGPGWLAMRDAAGRRRIDDKDDFVRIEIRWAIDNGVPVVPVLFDGAQMPAAADLPTVLRPLARCQAMPVRVDPDFRTDMQRLVEVCHHHLKTARATQRTSRDPS